MSDTGWRPWMTDGPTPTTEELASFLELVGQDGGYDQWNPGTEEGLAATAARLRELSAEVESLRVEMSTMHRTVVHECCVEKQEAEAQRDRLIAQIEDAREATEPGRVRDTDARLWAVAAEVRAEIEDRHGT